MQFINNFKTMVSETKYVHVSKVNTNLTMNSITKRSIKLYPKVGASDGDVEIVENRGRRERSP
jgi:hypothetical protein